MQQYQRFVDELAPRLETARALERQLDAHLARRFNVFDYLRRDELGLSRIVADLLNPEGKHGQGDIFLKRTTALRKASGVTGSMTGDNSTRSQIGSRTAARDATLRGFGGFCGRRRSFVNEGSED